MHNLNYIKATDIPTQLILDKNLKIKKGDYRYTVIHKFSTNDKKEELGAAKGIIVALIFCIPFWVLILTFALRLF